MQMLIDKGAYIVWTEDNGLEMVANSKREVKYLKIRFLTVSRIMF